MSKQTVLESEENDLKKGLFFLFVIIFSLTISGCKPKVEIKEYFKSGICVSTEDISFNGTFERNEKGIYLKVNYPKNLKGYTYNVCGDKVKISYMGIDDNCSLVDFPKAAPIRILKEVLEKTEGTLKKEADYYTLKSDDYIISVNKTGYIKTINNNKIKITFTNPKG